ncbi:hypothetical protein BT69DRAFT_749812 [Atractiella rhizophila]|nr:hypothetical protein BT69DRAFT_749812 [Atractiella rhizophila]
MVVGSKRPRTTKACEQCRKQKAHCEPSPSTSLGCHRCSVLSIPCSFVIGPPSESPLHPAYSGTQQSTATSIPFSSGPRSPTPSITPQSERVLTDTFHFKHAFANLFSTESSEVDERTVDSMDYGDLWSFLDTVLRNFEKGIENLPKAELHLPVRSQFLDQTKAQELRQIYDQSYSKWHLWSMPLQPNPFLTSVIQLTASEHTLWADPAITSNLQATVNQHVFRALSANVDLWSEKDVLDTIRAFEVLAQWVPISSTDEHLGLPDASMFRNTAIKLCRQIGLDKLEIDAEHFSEKVLLWSSVYLAHGYNQVFRGRGENTKDTNSLEALVSATELPFEVRYTLLLQLGFIRTAFRALNFFGRYSDPCLCSVDRSRCEVDDAVYGRLR